MISTTRRVRELPNRKIWNSRRVGVIPFHEGQFPVSQGVFRAGIGAGDLQNSAFLGHGIPWCQKSLGAEPGGATRALTELSPKCHQHRQVSWLWEQHPAGFQPGTALNNPENPRESSGMCPAPCGSCFRSCYISPSPPCSFFTSVGATTPGALMSFGTLRPPHPFFQHSPGSTRAKNSCCNRSPATWECSKLIINGN